MDLILLPKKPEGLSLEKIYHRALSRSKELYIVSAYLTEWGIEEPLGDQCESFLFIVGKDFGITRKNACRTVLGWLPADRHQEFMVAESINGFHPKAMFWRELDGKCYALLGSSNLTKAAFSTNYEANGFSVISDEQFEFSSEWIEQVHGVSVTLDETWLNKYEEARQPAGGGKTEADAPVDGGEVYHLPLPAIRKLKGYQRVLEQRRDQMKIFRRRKAELEALFRTSSKARNWNEARSDDFYYKLSSLWFFGEEGSRFQGKGWERKGRNSDFRELSKSLVRVLDASFASRDSVVIREINRLTQLRIPTRGALFSEMLCQFFPKHYFVLNSPVRNWFVGLDFSFPRGISKGERYVNRARLLRAALDRAENYPAKNLAELDCIIWFAST
ncbi:phospholipase D family protein [Pseudomonas oryzihabitans]|uniref:phospholipase D family protein n=1 Tax=Pseudomonas oryzihabitans TaxID=47885 RepID=UPI0011A0B687|nr:phospholipase D family protein [Pseudomonas oryzihabitans]